MKKKNNIPAIFSGILMILIVFMSGCTFIKIEEEERTSLDYTVVKEEDIPQELMRLIEEKKEKDFQMVYKSGEFLYLLRGYGRQMSGGYSIQVEDLNIGGGAIILKTLLIGPNQNEKQMREPSYPYIVLKLQYREEPVKFA